MGWASFLKTKLVKTWSFSLLLKCTLGKKKEEEKKRMLFPETWGCFLSLFSETLTRSTGVLQPGLQHLQYIHSTSRTSLSFPSFRTCGCFSVAAYGEFLSGASQVAYVAGKHGFKFSFNYCIFVLVSKVCLYQLWKWVSSVPQQRAGGLFKPEEFLTVTWPVSVLLRPLW